MSVASAPPGVAKQDVKQWFDKLDVKIIKIDEQICKMDNNIKMVKDSFKGL